MLNVPLIAAREFKATAMTKAFIFGVLVFPAVIIGVIYVITAFQLFKQDGPTLRGNIAIADALPGQPVASQAPTRILERLDQVREQVKEQMDRMPGGADAGPMADAAITRALGGDVEFEILPADADIELQKQRVRDGELVALVNIGPDALESDSVFDLWRSPTLGAQLVNEVRSGVSDVLVDERIRNAGHDPSNIRTLVATPSSNTRLVTETGETASAEQLEMIMPIIFMILLWISVFTGGQYLLMSTIEEKSSRVMEVLLSAVSPLQLMTGKIIGQGLVGLSILAIYLGVGLLAAGQFNVTQHIPFSSLVWLGVYFVMAYFMIAAMMAAVGSAVTEMREANSLMGPIMTVLMLPLFLWFLIMDNPNSVLAMVFSFFPPTTPFVMILRISQTAHAVPLWEILATTVVGFAGVFVMVWMAAKIFRIGVLMYGKPPSFMGLVRWIRAG
ncbi:MAG: ABC transporter permease [Phycisphaeraceae bacterium]|nr:MAG: ABC transporter permease [Phycisphaeraceae bacterium]